VSSCGGPRPVRRRLSVGLSALLLVLCAAPAQSLADATGGTAPPAAGKRGDSSAAGVGTVAGERARLLSDGTAQAPRSAPDVVARVVAAGNRIARLPYRYGGGHALLEDTAYDCSGSVSYALRGAGLFRGSADATGFFRYGEPGPGRWITIYSNNSHMFMVVAGLRFDTSGRAQTGSRWQTRQRSPAGYIVRHPPGL
jgi:cell wall-associated NlpC family hydrolase